jgi:acyl-coenzyme A synthetase/AMP-(fatty) acid ligase
MPNIPETVAAFLACASIGAIWSAAAPEFGVQSVVDRFAQIDPKVLIAVDGSRYGGNDCDVVELSHLALPFGPACLRRSGCRDSPSARSCPSHRRSRLVTV